MLSIVVINLFSKQKQEYGGILRQLSNYLERIVISETKMDQEWLTYVLQHMVYYGYLYVLDQLSYALK